MMMDQKFIYEQLLPMVSGLYDKFIHGEKLDFDLLLNRLKHGPGDVPFEYPLKESITVYLNGPEGNPTGDAKIEIETLNKLLCVYKAVEAELIYQVVGRTKEDKKVVTCINFKSMMTWQLSLAMMGIYRNLIITISRMIFRPEISVLDEEKIQHLFQNQMKAVVEEAMEGVSRRTEEFMGNYGFEEAPKESPGQNSLACQGPPPPADPPPSVANHPFRQGPSHNYVNAPGILAKNDFRPCSIYQLRSRGETVALDQDITVLYFCGKLPVFPRDEQEDQILEVIFKKQAEVKPYKLCGTKVEMASSIARRIGCEPVFWTTDNHLYLSHHAAYAAFLELKAKSKIKS